MANSYLSGCGTTVQIDEGWEASFNLRLTTEEIKIVLMGLKKRLKKAYDYAAERKEASKRKTKRMQKEQNEPFQKAVKKNHKKIA